MIARLGVAYLARIRDWIAECTVITVYATYNPVFVVVFTAGAVGDIHLLAKGTTLSLSHTECVARGFDVANFANPWNWISKCVIIAVYTACYTIPIDEIAIGSIGDIHLSAKVAALAFLHTKGVRN